LTAQAGALQVFTQLFVVEPFAQLQLIDNLLHEPLGRIAEPAVALLALFRCHLSDARRTHLAALDRHFPHTAVHLIPLQHRQRDRQNRGKHANGSKRRRDELRVHDRIDKRHHQSSAAPVRRKILEFEIDHLPHDQHARQHPNGAERDHEMANRRCEKRFYVSW
jgi:hypothetical protein